MEKYKNHSWPKGGARTGIRPHLACGPRFYRFLKRDSVNAGVTSKEVTSRSHFLSTEAAYGSLRGYKFCTLLSWTIFLGGWISECPPKAQRTTEAAEPVSAPSGSRFSDRRYTKLCSGCTRGSHMTQRAHPCLLASCLSACGPALCPAGRLHNIAAHPPSLCLVSRSDQLLPALGHFPFHASPALCFLLKFPLPYKAFPDPSKSDPTLPPNS